MSQSQKPVCAVCVRIRWFIAIAVPLVLLMGIQTDMQPPAVPLHEWVAEGIMIALAVVLAWRIFEYRQEKKAVSRLIERRRQRHRNSRRRQGDTLGSIPGLHSVVFVRMKLAILC